MKKSDSYKIIYHFNRFVFSIFKKNQKSHKAANKQLILTSKRNIVLPGTVVANVVKTNENEKQNNNNLDEDFFKQGNDDPDNFDLDNFNLDEIDFEALKKDKPDYKEKKTNEDIIIDDDLIEEITEPLENVLSKYVSYNIETREFIAKIYGFVILNDKKIEILPLTWYTEDKLNAYHYIYPGSDNQFPTLSDIKKIIDTEKIVHFLDDQTIKNQLEAIQKDPQKVGESILIGKGTNPQNGFVERFELKKNQPAEISSITENSKTDYQEKEYFVFALKDEVIVKHIPMIPAQNGIDVFGNTIPGQLAGKNPYQPGKNLLAKTEDPGLYASVIDGVLDITEEGTVNIEEYTQIDGDVNETTGNINFNGFAFIHGSVRNGFKVTAKKGLRVDKDVEDAYIYTEGKLIVQNGIVGYKTKIYSKRGLAARFIQNADISSEQNIYVSESVVQAICFSKQYIQVDGQVVGGHSSANYGLQIGIAGNIHETDTTLIAGKDPELDHILENVNIMIEELSIKIKDLLAQIKNQFGNINFNELQHLYNSFSEEEKSFCLPILNEIKACNEQIKKIRQHRQELKKSLEISYQATIKINDKVYPGVLIKIEDYYTIINKIMTPQNPFKVDHQKKVIVWD